MIPRASEELINKHLFRNKTVVIYGARQTGKTTLVNEIIRKLNMKTLILNGDFADIRELFTDLTPAKIKPVIGDNRLVVIDEAQRIHEPGLCIKIIHDNFSDIQLIVTGSSSLELSGKIKEPMTGRKFEFYLYPLSFGELSAYHGFLEEKRMLERRLVFGSYPDVIMNPGNETIIVRTLVSDYLYKDVLSFGQIKKPVLLEKLLRALALQVGNEVSYYELAQLIGSDKATVEKYIDLLEKAFIIFTLPALNRNVRNEIKKGRKIYFCDNGVRNAVIGNFLPVASRTDAGFLWENFLVSERIKYQAFKGEIAPSYFWRTTQQQEVDYIEEHPDRLFAYEFKWNTAKKAYLSRTFSKAYPQSNFRVITPDNYHEFLSGK